MFIALTPGVQYKECAVPVATESLKPLHSGLTQRTAQCRRVAVNDHVLVFELYFDFVTHLWAL